MSKITSLMVFMQLCSHAISFQLTSFSHLPNFLLFPIFPLYPLAAGGIKQYRYHILMVDFTVKNILLGRYMV